MAVDMAVASRPTRREMRVAYKKAGEHIPSDLVCSQQEPRARRGAKGSCDGIRVIGRYDRRQDSRCADNCQHHQTDAGQTVVEKPPPDGLQ